MTVITVIIVGIIIFAIINGLINAFQSTPKDITIEELCALRFSLDLTVLQKHEQWGRTYRWRTVVWEGTVEYVGPPYYRELDDASNSGYYIPVTVKPLSSDLDRFNVNLEFRGKEKEKLLSLKKGQRIRYSGRLGYVYEHAFTDSEDNTINIALDYCKLL
ncbi:MAG: hypothetical protein AAB332_02185 [Planctomycetota bacterium]